MPDTHIEDGAVLFSLMLALRQVRVFFTPHAAAESRAARGAAGGRARP